MGTMQSILGNASENEGNGTHEIPSGKLRLAEEKKRLLELKTGTQTLADCLSLCNQDPTCIAADMRYPDFFVDLSPGFFICTKFFGNDAGFTTACETDNPDEICYKKSSQACQYVADQNARGYTPGCTWTALHATNTSIA